MRGQLGVFYRDNRQIGGCLDWTVKVELIDGIDNRKRLHDWKATAKAYWFTETCRQFLACFFWIVQGKMILAYKGNLYVETLEIKTGKLTRDELVLCNHPLL